MDATFEEVDKETCCFFKVVFNSVIFCMHIMNRFRIGGERIT
jgi:hypothetical protein